VTAIDWTDAWRCGPLAYAITMAECAEVHRRSPLDRLTAAFAGWILVGRQLLATEVIGAHRGAAVLRAQALALFDDVDVLVSAGPVSPAPRLDALDAPVAGVAVNWIDVTARTMAPWSLLGFPVVAFPAGLSPAGLPVGVQLIAAPGADARLIELAALLDAQRDDRWPGRS
jgi:Asp-tRNA(Asn)/Glu-tRNA(Gln) amidotransferase A subunit family amidase